METNMRKPILTIVLAAILAACASTPPPPPTLDLPAATAGDLQLDRWWTAFGDPTLDKLVEEALANNLDIAAAIARVEYGRAAVLLAQSDLYPTVDLSAGASRSRTTQVGSNPLPFGFSPLSTDLAVGLQASYELDLWGKYHTATAAAQRDLMATEFARETVRTMVEADTARYYFNVLAADVELRLLLDTLKLRDESVALQKDRYQAGVIGEYDLRTAEAERASVAGDIAVARRAVTEFESALAVLLGRSPREVFSPSIARDVEIARLTAVPTLPSGVPSDLLLRRPDIQRAEAQLAAANLRIDVARDDYYPAISLTGNYGTQAGALKNLFTGPGVVWGLAASLLQPLIGLKAIEANVEAQTARRNEVLVNYKQAVQGAFRDAHDALSANDTTREALAAQSERAAKLQQALELSELRYTSGYSPYLEVLDAQRQLLQAQTLQIIAARNVRLSLVDFAKAVGGGWDYKTAVALP
jgi:multidrug efflux system outer membrane protein